MEPIHQTPHYSILQPPDASFLIVPRTKKTRQVLRDILAELDLETTTEPIRDDGSYRVQRNNPFRLVTVIERCEARMAFVEVERLRTTGRMPPETRTPVSGTRT